MTKINNALTSPSIATDLTSLYSFIKKNSGAILLLSSITLGFLSHLHVQLTSPKKEAVKKVPINKEAHAKLDAHIQRQVNGANYQQVVSRLAQKVLHKALDQLEY